MDDLNQTAQFERPDGSSATFLFRDTSAHAIEISLQSLGAYKKAPNYLWFLPSSGQLLECHVIGDVADRAIDLVWTAWEWYVPLVEAIGVSEENTVILDVHVRNTTSAMEALRSLALKLLEAHPGLVKDGTTERVWTQEEIANHPAWPNIVQES
jgi:hypothetical protein